MAGHHSQHHTHSPPAGPPAIPPTAPRLPRAAWRDIDAATAHGLAPQVARAVSHAAHTADHDPDHATALLAWAKHVAPRSTTVREALGIHAYRTGDYHTAARELHTYRRISGRQDHNHLLADSLRATGHPHRIRELVEAMGDDIDQQRRLEAKIVHAAALADTGDTLRAREILERAGGQPHTATPTHLRLWYLAAELSLQLHDPHHASELLQAITTIQPDYLDAADQLANLHPDNDSD